MLEFTFFLIFHLIKYFLAQNAVCDKQLDNYNVNKMFAFTSKRSNKHRTQVEKEIHTHTHNRTFAKIAHDLQK